MNTLQDDERGKGRRDRWSYVYLTVSLYIASCLLLYFGVVGALFDLLDSGDIHSWKLKPDPHIFKRLQSAAMTLVLPLCVAFSLMLALLFLMGPLLMMHDFIQRRRRKHNEPGVTKYDPPA
jgi:hypothetical protein